MAVTIEQRRSLSLAQARRKKAGILATGERMRNRDAPVGTISPAHRIRRTFEDIGEPDTSQAEGPGAGYRIGEANSMLAQEQGISPLSNAEPLGEAVLSDAGYGFHDPAGNFQFATEADHVLLQDRNTGRLTIYPRTPDMEEGDLMGIARMILGGAMGGAPTRMAGGVAGAAQKAARPVSEAAQTVQAFDRAGVNPSLVTALQNRATSVAANAIRNTPAGGPIERGIRGNIAQAQQGVENAASGVSNVGDVATAGANVRGAATDFIKSIVPTKQEELYGEAAKLIGVTGRTQMSSTVQLLDRMNAETSSDVVRQFITDPNVSKLAQTIRAASQEGVDFNTLRQLRTAVRGLKESQEGAVGLNKTAINRLYDALTKDMRGMALNWGGDAGLAALTKADRFTFRMFGEADDLQSQTAPVRVLRDLAGTSAAPKSDEAIFNKLRQWAGQGASADISRLNLTKRAILKSDNPQAWNDFTGTYLRTMGRVKPGAATVADMEEWSPSNFLTNYESMSPPARTVLFSESPLLRSALDDLLMVAASLKNVQKLGNPSGSGAHTVMMTTGTLAAGALFSGNMPALATIGAILGSGNVAARIMMNPRAVRWITGAYRTALQTHKMPPARADMSWRGYIRSLAAVAANDNEAMQAMTRLAEQLRQAGRPQRDEPTTSTVTPPQETEVPYQAQPR